MSQASITKAVGSIDELTRLVGVPVSLVSTTYNFTDGVVTHSTNRLSSASTVFGADVVGQAVGAIAGKIASGVTVTAQVDPHTLTLSATIADGAALTGTVVGTDITQAASTKIVSAAVPLAVLQADLAEYVDEDQNKAPQNGEEMLMAYANRASAVLAGSDTFSGTDIQHILAWLLVVEHGAL